ncbi:MAG: ATPase [Hyphomicrobiaceae bacterium]|nr:ATPase [Hyphomicrobiaceae bacterium]
MTGHPGRGGSGSNKIPGRESLRPPGPRRFYDAVTIAPEGEAFAVKLDGRQARTPGKNALVVPARALAEALAGEWSAQRQVIDPVSMPITRLVNTAIDGVTGKERAVRADVVAYAGSDLVCYRAERPQSLVAAQAYYWDPVLRWAEMRLGAKFKLAGGVMPVAQPTKALTRVAEYIEPFDAWMLSSVHLMTTLTGSALLTLAHVDGLLGLDETWRCAHVDEDWQISEWGEDREASERRELRYKDMWAASELVGLVRQN